MKWPPGADDSLSQAISRELSDLARCRVVRVRVRDGDGKAREVEEL